ncbi:MAG: sulfotransferase [Betaproteobacteria bacterium]|nr:sulfotransferase [Betaproteobacteria bacterium]
MLNIIGKTLSSKIIKNPIFVVGGSRSGTSVLVQALGKHKLIYSFKGEAPFITDIGGMVHNLEYAPEREISYYKNSLKVSHSYIYDNLRRLSYESVFGKNYGLMRMLKDMMHREFNPINKEFWCAKTFPNENVAKGLMKLYPSGKFILIHRNGIDVVHSRTQFHGFQIDDPQAVFQTVCDHLKIEYDPSPAIFTSTHQVHPLATVATSENVDVKKIMSQRSPVYESWTIEQRQVFKDVCAETMARMGYAIPF